MTLCIIILSFFIICSLFNLKLLILAPTLSSNVKNIRLFLYEILSISQFFYLSRSKNTSHKNIIYVKNNFTMTNLYYILTPLKWVYIYLKILPFNIYYTTTPLKNLIPRFFFRLMQTQFGFFLTYSRLTNFNNLMDFYKSYFFAGFKYIWKGLKYWFLGIVISFVVIYFNVVVKVLPLNKVIFIWFSFFMVLYWLVSGFVFFFKKYQFSKYTSVVQRFWRRSYILFWLLETCLLFVFIYLTFIASQESFFMFDQVQIYKTHLFSWRLFLVKILPIVIIIVVSYCLLLNIKWGVFSKTTLFILLITFFLTYIIWVEFYQFFHIVNFYGNLTWFYDSEEKIWNLEGEVRRTRIVNNYVMVLLILKFWHLLFVYGFWLFFVLRNLEKTKTRYPLFSANHQNLIILYIMSWLYMFPWFKLYFRKFMNLPYFWFYTSNRTHIGKYFYNDLMLFFKNFNLLYFSFFNNLYNNVAFFYWFDLNYYFKYYNTAKGFIRTNVVNSI